MNGGGPIRVLFVCTANICRSAYAELLARHLLDEHHTVTVSSAGIHGFVDAPVDAEMAKVLSDRGADPGSFRSRRLTMAMVDDADLVLTAEAAHRQYILDDRPAAFRRVFTLGQFERVVAELPDDLTGRELLREAGRRIRPAGPDDDVADPYRRGPDAAATAARRLDELLEPVLTRLAAR